MTGGAAREARKALRKHERDSATPRGVLEQPKTLTATFTLRDTFAITKPGKYTLTARGYQELPPNGKKYLGPRPFYFVKTMVDVVAGEEKASEDEREARRGWTPSGKGAGFGLGLAFFAPIFYAILGFGSARYQPSS